jgi:hypothetical protein
MADLVDTTVQARLPLAERIELGKVSDEQKRVDLFLELLEEGRKVEANDYLTGLYGELNTESHDAEGFESFSKLTYTTLQESTEVVEVSDVQ